MTQGAHAAAPPPAGPPPDPESAAQALDDLDQLLQRIPGAARLAGEVRDLRALLVSARPPRVAAVGRRGSGKSALANALLGRPVLAEGAVEDTTQSPNGVDLRVGGRVLRRLDTPGLRAGGETGRTETVAKALERERPDVVLVCVRATQVDAGVDEDLKEVKALLAKVRTMAGVAPAVIGVVTRVDELPAETTDRQPPYDADPVRREALEAAVAAFRSHLARHDIAVRAVVAVGAYQRFEADQRVTDWRWNLPALGLALFEALPREAQMEAARALEHGRTIRRRVAMRIVGTATSVAMVVGATPLPVADLALLLPLQGAMLTGVVYASGRPLGTRAVSEWLGAMGLGVGAGLSLREAVRAVLKLIPGLGATLAGAVAASGTWALGIAAVRYFIDGVTVATSRAAFDDALKGGAPPEAARKAEAEAEAEGRAETETEPVPSAPGADAPKVPPAGDKPGSDDGA